MGLWGSCEAEGSGQQSGWCVGDKLGLSGMDRSRAIPVTPFHPAASRWPATCTTRAFSSFQNKRSAGFEGSLGGCPGGFSLLHPRPEGCRLHPSGFILTFASFQPVHPILAVVWAPQCWAVHRAPQRPQLGRQNAIVPSENGKAAEGRDGAGAICFERGTPSPCSSGDCQEQSPGWRWGANPSSRVCSLGKQGSGAEHPRRWVPISHPPVCGCSCGQGGRKGGDLGGGEDHREGVAWPLRQPVSLSNMWSVAMAMPFDVASGRRWERWQR